MGPRVSDSPDQAFTLGDRQRIVGAANRER